MSVPIVALGDSITFGYPYGNSWTQLLEARLEISILNRGINGDTLEGMLMRLESDVLAHAPTFCLVMGGTNDVFTGFGLDDLKEITTHIDQALRDAKVIPVFGLPVPILIENLKQPLNDFRQWLAAWAEHTVPFYDAFVDDEGRIRAGRLPDGVHPDDEGYQRMADIAEPILRQLLAGA